MNRATLLLGLVVCACGSDGGGEPFAAGGAAGSAGSGGTSAYAGAGGSSTGGDSGVTGGAAGFGGAGTGGVAATGGTGAVAGSTSTGGTGGVGAGGTGGWQWTDDCKPWPLKCSVLGKPGGQAFCPGAPVVDAGSPAFGCCVTEYGPCGYDLYDGKGCVPVCL